MDGVGRVYERLPPGKLTYEDYVGYWIVDPVARTLEVYEADGAEYRRVGTHEGAVTGRAVPFPDLDIDLGRVWT